MKERRFECKFCGGKFVYEDRFLRHKCKQMIRDEEFRTPIGQAAWHFYQEWMKAYRRQVPRSSAFLHSKFYSSFIRFAKFVKRVHLPDSELFVRLMKEKDISPTIWTNDQVYAIYLEFMDRKAPPLKQAGITVNTLMNLADEKECNVEDIFDHIAPNELIQLMRERRLSPWILLNSSKFKQFFVDRVSPEERIVLESIIRVHYWQQKFTSQPDDVERMRAFVRELNL